MPTPLTFKRASKTQSKLRMAIDGPSGSGKTYTGLIFATALANGGKVAVVDTERGRAALYSDTFTFDHIDMREQFRQDTFDPLNYIQCIDLAEQEDYAVLLIDSLSHAWEGEGGVLDMHDQAVKREKSGNRFTAWKDVSPTHRKLVDAMVQSSCHIIATMRSKTEYVLTTNDRGQQVPKKVGMAPVQRPGIDYEFDLVGEMDIDHNLIVTKTRCTAVDGAVVNKPTAQWFGKVLTWLNEGAPAPVVTPQVKRHWIDEPGAKARFDAWATNLTLTDDDITAALGSPIGEFEGTKPEAKALIEKYIVAKTGGAA